MANKAITITMGSKDWKKLVQWDREKMIYRLKSQKEGMTPIKPIEKVSLERKKSNPLTWVDIATIIKHDGLHMPKKYTKQPTERAKDAATKAGKEAPKSEEVFTHGCEEHTLFVTYVYQGAVDRKFVQNNAAGKKQLEAAIKTYNEQVVKAGKPGLKVEAPYPERKERVKKATAFESEQAALDWLKNV